MKRPQHAPFCAAMPDFHPEGPCDCGLTELIAWRAQAEALAGALDEALVAARNLRNGVDAEAHRSVILRRHGPPCGSLLDFCILHDAEERIAKAEAALARLPADALAERRALETCAYVLTLWDRLREHKTPPVEATKAALAARAAARKGTV